MAADPSDEQLLRDCLRDRQNASWERVLHVFHRAIALSIIRTLGQPKASDTDYVDDRIQDVYVRLLENNHRIFRQSRAENPAQLVALVKTVAATTTLDHLDWERALVRLPDEQHEALDDVIAAEQTDSGVEERLDRESLIHQVERALNELCRRAGKPIDECRDRNIFWLCYRQGYTAKQIAAIPTLKLNHKGVESALARIVKNLREFFGENREGQTP